jgi:para-nitrobenzyl esterase
MYTLDNAYAQVKSGWLQGERLASGVKVFRGIPFAAPPIGKLRWQPPVPPAEWRGVRKAMHFGSEAVQEDDLDCEDLQSEDCLYLNVWTPAETYQDKLPVFVWIHGGSLQIGAGSHFLYNSAVLAEKGIIVVTINYRLGIFGFFAHPELTEESGHSSGNYGLMDQLMAIRWVRENIAGFGGDPERITIGGQSAGALSVSALVASPLAKGLFSRATIQSGPPFGLSEFYLRIKEAEAEGRNFMTVSDIKNLAGLRAIPAWELFKKSHEYKFTPRIIIDGWLLPDYPGNVIRAGKHNQVALLLGSTSHEFSDGYSPEHGMAAEEYQKKVRDQFGTNANKLLELYPAGDPVGTALSSIRLGADNMFAGTRLVARMAREHGNDVYLYFFTRVLPKVHGDFYGANHSVELPFLFHLADKGAVFPWDNRKWEELDYQYSEIVMSFWSNFIKDGDPNAENLPKWPKYSRSEDKLMEFGDRIFETAAAYPEKLAVLEGLF